MTQQARHHIRYLKTASEHLDIMQAVSDRSFPRHTHDLYGIGMVMSGGHRSASDEGMVEAIAGDMITVNPGEVHDGHACAKTPRSWKMIYLSPQLVQEALSDLGAEAASGFRWQHPVIPQTGAANVAAAFRQALMMASVADPLIAGSAEYALQNLLLRSGSSGVRGVTPLRGEEHSGLRYARQKLDEDPAAQMSMEELAVLAGMSRFSLYRAFLKSAGLSPQAYLLQRRLALARSLMRRGWRVIDAALEAGFSDQSHFHRHFARQFGVTPGQYVSGL